MGGHTNMFKFIPRSAEEVFVEFWGGTSPFAGMAGNLNPRGHKCFRPVVPNPPPKNTCAVVVPTEIPKKPAPIVSQLQCTLEELTLGCIKKIKVARTELDAEG
jgi:DnaJ family protein B protein 4